jgi:hypothetical protein
VQGPKNKIYEVSDRADVPFEDENDDFDPVPISKEKYKVQLNVETFLM